MTKTIHLIKLGELGDFEISCLNSWKKVYPDFQIKVWSLPEILSSIQDCPYAVFCYQEGKFAFVTDYVRLKALYEFGGLYMDTDVFCGNRIPDPLFEKSFTSWDPGFSTYWTQSGTCIYAASPKEPFFQELISLYQSFDTSTFHDNTIIETVIRKYGINFSDRTTCQLTNQELAPLNVFNCAQFGAFDYNQNLMWKVDPIFLVHARSKSWAWKEENVYLFYIFVNEETDHMEIYNKVLYFQNVKNENKVLILALNCVTDKVNWFSKYLKLEGLNYLVAPLGNRLEKKELSAAFLDFVSKRFSKVKFCKEL